MDFTRFFEVFDGALEYFSNAGWLIMDFFSCLPNEVRTYLFAIFVVIFGGATLILIFRILK